MEIDARRLYLREGCASLFTYCTQVLHLADGSAYNRIEAARAARKYPLVLEALESGSITLTTARLLAPHLTERNHREVLEAAHHKSTCEIKLLVATLHPKPSVPTVLRRVPGPGPCAAVSTSPTTAAPLALAAPVNSSLTETLSGASLDVTPHTVEPPETHAPSRHSPASPDRARPALAPLSASTYRLQVTLPQETHDKLRRKQDLLRHALPTSDVAAIIDRALTLLLADLERRRCAAAARPRAGGTNGPSANRHIPAAVKRAVWQRDQGRCAFVGASGRCRETSFLEFHHVEPCAAGGAATIENIQLRCRAHNLYEATLSLVTGATASGRAARRSAPLTARTAGPSSKRRARQSVRLQKATGVATAPGCSAYEENVDANSVSAWKADRGLPRRSAKREGGALMRAQRPAAPRDLSAFGGAQRNGTREKFTTCTPANREPASREPRLASP